MISGTKKKNHKVCVKLACQVNAKLEKNRHLVTIVLQGVIEVIPIVPKQAARYVLEVGYPKMVVLHALFVQLVKQKVVVVQRALNATKGRIKT